MEQRTGHVQQMDRSRYAESYKARIAKTTGKGHIYCGTINMSFYLAQMLTAVSYSISPLATTGFLVESFNFHG